MCKIIYHPNYANYNLGPGHPFDPVRIEMLIDLLKEFGVLSEFIMPDPVSPEELYRIHDQGYIRTVESVSLGHTVPGTEKYGLGTLDNPITPGMAEAARYQAGGTLLAARMLM